jgi:hypothetical protein
MVLHDASPRQRLLATLACRESVGVKAFAEAVAVQRTAVPAFLTATGEGLSFQ